MEVIWLRVMGVIRMDGDRKFTIHSFSRSVCVVNYVFHGFKDVRIRSGQEVRGQQEVRSGLADQGQQVVRLICHW